MPVAYIPGMCDMPGEVVSGSSYALHVIYVYTDYRICASSDYGIGAQHVSVNYRIGACTDYGICAQLE